MTSASQLRFLTIGCAFAGFMACQAAVIIFAANTLHGDIERTQIDNYAKNAIAVRSAGATTALHSAMADLWSGLDRLTALLVEAEGAENHVDALTTMGGVMWVGVADLNGKVVTASGGMLLGADVSTRPWFRSGLQGKYMGDVHDAVLLNRLLGGTEENPIRLVDLAAPIIDKDGQTLGVVGIHVDASWLSALLRTIGNSLQLELFLIGADAQIKLATRDLPVDRLDLPSVRSDSAGKAVTSLDTWPDGKPFVTATLPFPRFSDAVSLDWRVIARIDPSSFENEVAAITSEVWKIFLGVLAVSMAIGFAFWKVYLCPVRRLARTGRIIAEGHLVAPPKERATREYSDLSTAIAELQAQALDRANKN